MKLPKTVNICGKTYTVQRDKDSWGGSCTTGHQKIVVGAASNTTHHRRFTSFVHEVLEAVSLERRLRFESADDEVVFVMTHKQFSDYAMDVATALKPMLR